MGEAKVGHEKVPLEGPVRAPKAEPTPSMRRVPAGRPRDRVGVGAARAGRAQAADGNSAPLGNRHVPKLPAEVAPLRWGACYVSGRQVTTMGRPGTGGSGLRGQGPQRVS